MRWDSRDLAAAFLRVDSRRAQEPPPARALLVESLDPTETFFAAVDSVGSWTLVVSTRKAVRPIPALRLSLLSADYGTTYELRERDDARSVRACIVRCIAQETGVQNLFATVCATLLHHLPMEPSDADVEAEVSKWVSLFWRLQMPARTSVIGLIGELTLLDRVDDLRAWVRAWHIDPADTLDFAFSQPQLSVEVKATTSQQRAHVLSLHQAAPLVMNNHFFASVIVELRDTGVRVGDVVGELGDRLANQPEADLLWRSVGAVCGASLDEFFDARYMRDAARSSLQFYAADTVPQPSVEYPLPAGVSEIRFRSDFSSVIPAEDRGILRLEVG